MASSSKSRLILAVQFSLMLVYIIVVTSTTRQEIFRGEHVVGIALVLSGVAILVSALVAYRRTLGTLRVKISPDPAGHGGLITSGIYAKIRHPFYSATPLIMVGVMLILHKPWCALVIICSIPLLYWKSAYEEQLLAARFPEYPAYRRRTGRFFPQLGKKIVDHDN